MSTTTESAGLTAGTTGATTEATTGSWELAVQRQRAKVAQQAAAAAQRGEADSARTKALAHARACRLEQALTHNLDVVPTGDLLFHPASVAHAAAAQHGGGHGITPGGQQHYFAATAGVAPLPPAAPAAQQQAAQAAPQQQPVGLDLPSTAQHRPLSPSPLELFGDPLFGGSTAPAGDSGQGGGGGGGHGHGHGGLLLDDHHLHDDDLLRIPSPPPLPADWETAPRPGLLFDFDQVRHDCIEGGWAACWQLSSLAAHSWGTCTLPPQAPAPARHCLAPPICLPSQTAHHGLRLAPSNLCSLTCRRSRRQGPARHW